MSDYQQLLELKRMIPDWGTLKLIQFQRNIYVEHETVRQRSEEAVESFRREHGITVYCNDYDHTDDTAAGAERPAAAPVPKPVETFGESQLPRYILDTCDDLGFERPTAVQSQLWPCILAGFDVVAVAQTGSGKTLAYALPGVMHIMQQPLLEPGDGPIVLTLCPTRELASQIEENVQNFCSPCRLRCRSVFGGVPKREQIAMLTRGPIEFLVATPGRLLDLIDSDVVSLTRTSLLVLDEADKMLNMGFQLFIRKIEVLVRPDRQTVLLSATMPKEIEEIAHVLCAKKTATQPPSPGLNAQRVGCVTVRIGTDLQYLQQPPGGGAGETGSATPPAEGEDPQVLLYASSEFSACRNIAQRVVVVEAFDDRLRAVEAEVAAAPRPHKILVFCNTKVGVEDLSTRLTRTFSQPPPGPANGGAEQAVEILSIHGGLPQTERTSVVARFKEPAAKDGVVVLVATGLMSRGVEVPDVGLVICFDFPPSVEEYVHRIGRTGRAGAKGASLAFVTHKSYSLIPDLVEFLDQAGSDVPAAVEALLPGGKRKRTLVTADGAGGPPAAKRGRAAVIEAPRLAKSAWRKTGPAVGARPQPGGGGGPGPEGPQDEHEEREEPQLQQQLQPQETVTYFACNPSPVLLLRNVCAPGNVDPTLKEDFWEECERLAGGKGTVLDVVVYEHKRWGVLAALPEEEVVRVFIRFRSALAAREAWLVLHGRQFDGRTVVATFYDPQRFLNNDLAPSEDEPRLTTTVLLRNMALIEELDDDFVPDIVNELESFGKVETCEVVVADPVAYPSLIPQERVRVFVRFANYQAAMQALVNLDGRTYAGKQIAGHLYDDIRASLGDFLPSETSEPPLPLRCLI